MGGSVGTSKIQLRNYEQFSCVPRTNQAPSPLRGSSSPKGGSLGTPKKSSSSLPLPWGGAAPPRGGVSAPQRNPAPPCLSPGGEQPLLEGEQLSPAGEPRRIENIQLRSASPWGGDLGAGLVNLAPGIVNPALGVCHSAWGGGTARGAAVLPPPALLSPW